MITLRSTPLLIATGITFLPERRYAPYPVTKTFFAPAKIPPIPALKAKPKHKHTLIVSRVSWVYSPKSPTTTNKGFTLLIAKRASCNYLRQYNHLSYLGFYRG